MSIETSYLAERAAERRWRAITGLVAVAALVAAAIWVLDQHADPTPPAAARAQADSSDRQHPSGAAAETVRTAAYR